MKRYLLGFLSVLLLVGSIMGASSKKPRPGRSGRADGPPAMWI